MNQILKTTALFLIYDSGVQRINKNALKKIVPFLSDVDIQEPSKINWRDLHYKRNNTTYRMMMNICYLVLHELLLTTENGKHKLASFLNDQQMSRLYEKFILEYYKTHYAIYSPSSKQINWDTDNAIDFLPQMQSDVMLFDNNTNKKMIIDAKYYTKIIQSQYESKKIRSNHLYQIFTYVKNEDKKKTGLVDGILLYAMTDEDPINFDYILNGNRIGVRTLDLNMKFIFIKKQLNDIINEWIL